MSISRRNFIQTATVITTASSFSLNKISQSKALAKPIEKEPFLIGFGAADMTGAVAGQGMMGYSELDQVATGLRQRYFARAFIIINRNTKKRFLYVLADIGELFDSVYRESLKRIKTEFGNIYTDQNTMMTCSHNHNSCGGTAYDYAYTLASFGFKKNSFEAEVAGIVDSVRMAHRKIAPGSIAIGRSELHNASANRSRVAFELNPQKDKDYYPNAIDRRVTVFKFTQNGKEIGVLSWFATHGTSLTDANTYISPDNKGIASYKWEYVEKGWRYMESDPEFVAAFAQSSPGDITPNLDAIPLDPKGPTDNHVKNAEIIAYRQLKAVKKAYHSAKPLKGTQIKSLLRYVDMSNQQVEGRWTLDGKPGITTPSIMGAGAAATSEEDNTKQPAPFLKEGMKDIFAKYYGMDIEALPTIPQKYLSAQAPKVNLLPLGFFPPYPWNPQIVPIQLTQIGEIIIAAAPVEFTIVAALRIRRLIAKDLKVPLDNVICQSYANSYVQYCTTPEEYESQQYEGGETQFGRYELPAFLQNFHALAQEFIGKKATLNPNLQPSDKSKIQPDFLPPIPPDTAPANKNFGEVLVQPKNSYKFGETVTVDFVGGHPNNNLHRKETYIEVQHFHKNKWIKVADDATYETTFHWERPAGTLTESINRVIWVLNDSQLKGGKYRIIHHGDWKSANGEISPYTGISKTFSVYK